MEFPRMSLRAIWPFIVHVDLFLCMEVSWSDSATTFGNKTDRIALLAFKYQIIDDPLGILSSWNDTIPFCNWEGVACSHRPQRVTALDLAGRSLGGSISPHIGNLTFLRIISLTNNSFHGIIPQEIGRLSQLRQLNLTQNLFSGEISKNLTHCSNLRTIDLNWNQLISELPVELSSLSKLLIMRLAANNLTGSIPPSFGNLSTPTHLSLGRNNLEGNIPNDLSHIESLQFLQISQNKLSGTVPRSLYNLSSMYIFSVVQNQLYGRLPPDLGLTLPNLQMLHVGGNQFTGSIPVSLSNASGLVELYFVDNNFSGSVPLNLGNLKGLLKLNIGINQLGTAGDTDLSFLDSFCSNLELLALDNNNLRGVLPNSIAKLSTHLQMLTVGTNQIYESIPTGIENLVSLILLAMDNNLFTGTIPIYIGKLRNLQILYLARNKFSGKIPFSLGNITLLNEFYLGERSLQGSIPLSLGNCQYMKVLNLSQNNLSGTIPKPLLSLSTLSVSLNLAQNSLTGSLPLEVGNLKNLRELEVSMNKLSSEIPSTLGNCLSMEHLYMDSNFFQGIPPSLSNLRGLQDLDLSRNQLSGQIPNYLGKFPFLQRINFSFNDLKGDVPKEGVFGNMSLTSILGNRRLCGGIPKLRLPTCSAQSSKKEGRSVTLKVTIPVISVVISFILLSCFLGIKFWIRKMRKSSSSTSSSEDGYFKVSCAELLKATDEFSSTNLIGVGSYGSVYKGILHSGEKIVAVKVLNLQQRGASKSFKAECDALRNIRHRNLIKILSSCSSIDFKGNEFKALVYEFVPNGSLEEWLHPKPNEQHGSRNLNLIQRLNVAIDVASSLDYLHHCCQTPIVHCDLKPSNILLDNDMSPHVGDFGLARFLSKATSDPSPNQSSSVWMMGSVGYVAPEYSVGGKVSSLGDVYSYGILLLEMFTGKRPTEEMFTDGLTLHKYAEMSLPERVKEIVAPILLLEQEDADDDKGIRNSDKTRSYVTSQMERCLISVVDVGILCSAKLPRKRLSMRDASMEMNKVRDFLIGARTHGQKESRVDTS